MLILTVLQGPDKGRRFELPDDEPQIIGRSSEALPLTDRTISRRHAALTPDDGRWYINDQQSSNGTFVNGVRARGRVLLQAGDQIRTGSTLLVFGDEGVRRHDVRVAKKGELDVSVEKTVASNDDSVIMAVPDPSAAAVFQLKVIYELTALIGSETNQSDLLERVMDVIFEYFRADRGFILLQDDPKHKPRAEVVRHRVAPRTKDEKQITISRTITQYVMRKAVGVLSSNAMNDSRFASGDSVQAYGIRSAMAVPIRFNDKLFGVIHLDSQVANYTYTEDQLTLLTAIGVQTGVALANARLQAERLQKERLAAAGQTVASLSHSIKNIIQGLRGGADVVELGLRKGNMNVVKNGWDITARNIDRVSGLTLNMLAFSKERDPDLMLASVQEVLDDVVDLSTKPADSRSVALITDIDPDLPEILIDTSGLHQAVLNLVHNAIDAVSPDDGVVTLSAEHATLDDEIVITVSDNGPGIPEYRQDAIFEPFNSTKGQRGTGLGLVVTKKVIQEQGGRVTVQSTEGEGTTFRVHLDASRREETSANDTAGPDMMLPE